MTRWLPSRHRFALMKLVAFALAPRRTAHGPRPTAIYAIDRDQSAIESYGLAILYPTIVACHLAAILPVWAAILLAPIAIQIPIYISGIFILPKWRDNTTAHSRMMMTLLIAASIALRSPVAWAFLALVAANALAAVVMFILRERVRELERRCAA
jgi:hypothetical protein